MARRTSRDRDEREYRGDRDRDSRRYRDERDPEEKEYRSVWDGGEDDYDEEYENYSRSKRSSERRRSERDQEDREDRRNMRSDREDQRGRNRRGSSKDVDNWGEGGRHSGHKSHRRKNHPILNFFSKLFCLVQTAATGVVAYGLFTLNLLPLKLTMIGIGIMVALLLLTWVLGLFRGAAPKLFSIFLALLITLVLGLAGVYLFQTNETLSNITEGKTIIQKDEMVVVVLKDSTYENTGDIAGKTLGIQTTLDTENTQKALEELNQDLNPTVIKREFSGMVDLVQELYNHGVEAILFNASYWDLIEDEFETFTEDTKVLNTLTYEKEVEVGEDKVEKDVTKETFIVYLSGIDTYGDVSSRSRSDVNILAVINPVTRQIALITTPRDYYVPIALDSNPMDKLTHAGIYGIDCSIKTLENLYGIDIDYYVRLNFTGFIDVVNALDGVDVYSSNNFSFAGHSFTVGTNHVDGEAALAFVRERHSFADGDFQRQRNQMEMIRAIIKKIASPAILTSYSSLLESIQGSFNTDMGKDKIADIVKMQLNDSSDWSISSYGVSGEGTSRTTYSMGDRALYVCLQDEQSIATAKQWIENIKNGVILEDGATELGNQE